MAQTDDDSSPDEAFPSPCYILPTHLSPESIDQIEDEVISIGIPLTYDAKEAKMFLSKVTKKARAAFDLRARGVWTEERFSAKQEHKAKRRRGSVTNSSSLEKTTPAKINGEATAEGMPAVTSRTPSPPRLSANDLEPDGVSVSQGRVVVIELRWLKESVRQCRPIAIKGFVTYDARRIPKARSSDDVTTSSPGSGSSRDDLMTTPTIDGSTAQLVNSGHDLLARARADAAEARGEEVSVNKHLRRGFQNRSHPTTLSRKAPSLRRTTTSEFERESSESLPPAPDWVKDGIVYSCLRSTFDNPPNSHFIAELSKIRESRILTLDQIGVRAYSTSIASLSAYPYPFRSQSEIMRLPGCDERLASHFTQYLATSQNEGERYLPAARELDEDVDLQHLKKFYGIWGCGAETARKMYFTHGWRNIDDVVEFGWNTLTKAQQIGVKFHDEFNAPISRKEMEQIAAATKTHARRARRIVSADWEGENDVVVIIVGGYRRGKDRCGDVDIIVTHRNPDMTQDLIVDLVSELEQSGHITHTLTIHTTNTERGQQTLPYKMGHGSHGFDSLDKALCVWQDPNFETLSAPSSSTTSNEAVSLLDPDTSSCHDVGVLKRNPKPHRRVDIIVSPWRTIGAAVLGWSGGTTFERDIRRFCKKVKNWKFDSSGVRDRATGRVLDLESPRTGDEEDTWLAREKRLMGGLGIGWRPPEERCTG